MNLYWMRKQWQAHLKPKSKMISRKRSSDWALPLVLLLSVLAASAVCLIAAVSFMGTSCTSRSSGPEPSLLITKPIPTVNYVPTVLRYIWSGPTTLTMWLSA